MRSQLLFYSFDTKSKPGKIIGLGIRFETQEFESDGTFDKAKFPLLCTPNLPPGVDGKKIKAIVERNL